MSEVITDDIGTVKAVNSNLITVEIERGGGCKSCNMRGFCIRENKAVSFNLISDIPLSEGDKVQLDIAPGGRVLASLMIFGVPLLALFAGFLVSSRWVPEIIAILAGFAAMAISFLVVRVLDKSLARKLNITIMRKL